MINASDKEPESVSLSGKGLALCHFLFRDAAALGLDEKTAWSIGTRLIEQWDGSKSLAEMYKRTESWPSEVRDAR